MKFPFSSLWVIMIIILVSTSCSNTDEISCEGTFFGRPIAQTGMSADKCKPVCECSDFSSKLFTLSELEKLKEWRLTTPFELLTDNPYNDPVPPSSPAVCAVVVDTLETKAYHLESFPDATTAMNAGAYVTHYDKCGVCSTLEDLAVYAGNLDIGADVKECGLRNLNAPFEELVACIEALGFTKPCAQIWAYNVKHTQKKCIQECLKNDPYNLKNGELSPCLACDEKYSGPVFKAVAGRTRRNTGIASSICRKCEEVQPVDHNYPE
ncbi:MAG: hypothetical protein K1X55_06425 [Chitinophagales bacterium]|nr:hypothetical protein [Chitinophagales bacterium]